MDSPRSTPPKKAATGCHGHACVAMNRRGVPRDRGRSHGHASVAMAPDSSLRSRNGFRRGSVVFSKDRPKMSKRTHCSTAISMLKSRPTGNFRRTGLVGGRCEQSRRGLGSDTHPVVGSRRGADSTSSGRSVVSFSRREGGRPLWSGLCSGVALKKTIERTRCERGFSSPKMGHASCFRQSASVAGRWERSRRSLPGLRSDSS